MEILIAIAEVMIVMLLFIFGYSSLIHFFTGHSMLDPFGDEENLKRIHERERKQP